MQCNSLPPPSHFGHHLLHVGADPSGPDEQNRRWDPRDEMQHHMESSAKRPRMMHAHDMLQSPFDGLPGVGLGAGARPQQPGLQTLAAVAADGEMQPGPCSWLAPSPVGTCATADARARRNTLLSIIARWRIASPNFKILSLNTTLQLANKSRSVVRMASSSRGRNRRSALASMAAL